MNNTLDMNKLLSLAAESGQFSREELESIENLALMKEKKDEQAHIEAEPPLMSDQLFTFAQDVPERSVTIRLKILGFDYFDWFLPRFIEMYFALTGETNAQQLLSVQPEKLILKTFATILDRPKRDRLKVSLLETLAKTFSTEEQPVKVGFLYICPPDELIEACWKLVEINQKNFTRAWGRVPLPIQSQLGLTYLTITAGIANLNEILKRFMFSMSQESQDDQAVSGGPSDTGTDSFIDSSVSELEKALPA